jgi:hypothetical protein
MLDSTIDAPQLSISDPRYNIREIVKQMILLEQHLLEKNKYCPDCISKHILTIEALAEEAQCLDKEQRYGKVVTPLVSKARVWGAAFGGGVPVKSIGQDVRRVRKQLAPHVVSPMVLSEVTGVAELAVDFGGFQRDDVGQSSALPWAIILGGLGLVLWYTERQNRRLT